MCSNVSRAGSLIVATIVCAVASATFAAPPPAPARTVRTIKVLPDRAPDCTSLKSIVQSVTRDCRTNDEKAIALYNFMQLTHYHRAYPGEPGGTPVLKEIHCYGWSLCGGLHAEQSALWRELGWDWRFVGWPGHTTVEAFYDGRWHYLDVFLKLYAWMPDPSDPSQRILAGQDDLADNADTLLEQALVYDPDRHVMYARDNAFTLKNGRANWQAPAFLVCGDELPGVIATLRQRTIAGRSEDWGGVQHATGDYSAEVHLAPGWGLTSSWDPLDNAWFWTGSKVAPCHTCGDKGFRNSPEKGPLVEPYLGRRWNCESYANGQLTFRPDLTSPQAVDGFTSVENLVVHDGALRPRDPARPARATVLLQSPYLLTQARGAADAAVDCEVSIDQGKTWVKADFADFGRHLAGQLAALIRLSFAAPVRQLELTAIVQNNPFALPYLSPGKNRVTISVADPAALGPNSLVVTYAFRKGSRSKSYEQLLLEGKEISRGHDAEWDEHPTLVQKTFQAADLPATFDIEIPTPRGRHPVFPRMVFVRREVVVPGQTPLPVPTAQPPLPASDAVLATLPNPLLTGITPPVAAPASGLRTVTHVLPAGQIATRSGSPVTNAYLRWPKTADESVDPSAYLIRGDLPPLPPIDRLQAARLVFRINDAHDRASTRFGVVALKEGAGQAPSLQMEALGATLGSVVVPRDIKPDPAGHEFRIDVTRYVQSVISGTVRHHGFAWRVIPDRAVDDGWTVRIQMPKEPRIVLELDVSTPATP